MTINALTISPPPQMYISEGRKRTNLLHTSIEPPKLKSIVKCSSIPLLPQNSVYTSSHLRIFLLLFISIRPFYPQRHPLSPTPFRIFYPPPLYIYSFLFRFSFFICVFFCALLLSCVRMGPSSPFFCIIIYTSRLPFLSFLPSLFFAFFF